MSRGTEDQDSFREKTVVNLHCKFCDKCLSWRGMKANLLADTSVELFSTDSPLVGNVSLVGDVYRAEACFCSISDVACLGCGNVVGYHVTRPCMTCLSSCNNGHFWMFYSDASYQDEQFDKAGAELMKWENLQGHNDDDICMEGILERCISEECLR